MQQSIVREDIAKIIGEQNQRRYSTLQKNASRFPKHTRTLKAAQVHRHLDTSLVSKLQEIRKKSELDLNSWQSGVSGALRIQQI